MCTPPNTWFHRPMQVLNPNGTSTGSAVFAQLMAKHPYTLEWAALSPKNYPFWRLIWTPISYMVSWVHTSPQPKWHLNRFSSFAGLITVTDRPTIRPTDHTTQSVTIGGIYVRSTAMQPKNAPETSTTLLSKITVTVQIDVSCNTIRRAT